MSTLVFTDGWIKVLQRVSNIALWLSQIMRSDPPPSSIIKHPKYCFMAILIKAFCPLPPPPQALLIPFISYPNSKSQKTSFFQAFLLDVF